MDRSLSKTRSRPRILVAAFAMEANSFASGATGIEDFRAQVWRLGGEVTPDALGPDSELAAAWRELVQRGCEIVPAMAAWSAPRPALRSGVVAEVVERVLAACERDLDGAYLMLHGSAVAADDPDPEGTLLTALRARIGPATPIAISLDCHAHLTETMVAAVDIVTAYRTCPHVDTERTGTEAARLLADTLDGRIRPVVAMAGRPMITPPHHHDNEREPFRSLMRRSAALESSPVLACALLPVQPWIDVPGLGWKAVATANDDVDAARRAAETLISSAWTERSRFLTRSWPPIDAALTAALELPGPVVVADTGDATNGGSTGDSTELLRAALPLRRRARILLSVTDARAAAQVWRADRGASLDVKLGTGPAGAYNAATTMHGARVDTVFDGQFRYSHPVYAGYRASTGKAALLRSEGLHVVVHERSVGVIDPALYSVFDLDLASMDILQAKSHISYRAGFAPVTTRSVLAETPGPTTAALERLPYTRRPRPLFPFELH